MLEKLKEKLRPLGEALAALDGSQGVYLANLENRILRLEESVRELTQSIKQ